MVYASYAGDGLEERLLGGGHVDAWFMQHGKRRMEVVKISGNISRQLEQSRYLILG